MNDSDKTKEQLIQEIELLRTLIDALPDRLYVKDEKGRFVICNKAVIEYADLPISGNLIGKSDFDLFPPELARTLYAAEQETMKTGKPVVNEESHRISRKNGRDIWSLTTKLPWRDKNGNIIGIIGSNRDITKRKKTELALLESENRYKAIFESAREGILIVDIETKRFKFTNPAFCRIFGYAAEELARMTISDIHPRKHLPNVLAEFDAHAQGKTVFSHNIPCLRKNRDIFYVDIGSTVTTIDGRPSIVGFFIDTTERKHTEDALRESEQKYRLLVEQLPAITYTASLDEISTTLYVSPQTQEILGVSPEEYAADPNLWQNMIHPDDHDRVMAEVARSHQTGEPFNSEYRMLAKNRRIVWVRDNAKILKDDHGNPLYLQGVMHDITASKQAEEALRESEARYKAIFESAREGIFVTDIKTKQFKYANLAICKMFGYTEEELKQMSVPDLHPEEYAAEAISHFDAMAHGKREQSRNVPCLRKGGTIFYADINTIVVTINNCLCNVGFFTDITERKHVEDALRESEARYKAIFNYATEGIIVADIETKRFKYANQAACKMFGYTAEELQQIAVYDIHPKESMPFVIAGFEAQARGEKTLLPNVPCLHKNGTVFYANIGATGVVIDQRPCNVGLFTDITEHRKAEEQLQKAHEELEMRVRQKTTDLARVVEDLQNEIAERKHAEEFLRNTEARFRTIFENTIVGLYRTTPDGRILLANPALVKMMGCKSFEELAKLNLEKEGFDPSTPRSIFKNRIKKDGRVIGLESVWLRPDGTKLFVSESAFAVKDGKGKILYYEGTAHDITKRKEAEEKLMLYQQQLRSLASELSLAEERLRRRIAAELHDHIAQNLAISKIKLESLAGDAEPNLVKSLNEVNGLISQTIEATRSLTFEISPPVLYELGFEAAVNWLAKQTRQRFGLEVELADDGKPKPLNADIRVLLFQAVRELLVNVIKHARAKKAKIFICRIQKNIQITVEDNGVGFNVKAISAVKDPAKGGFGLFNIRERLDQIGGSVIINARAGKGTRITLTAPIEKQEKPRTRFSGARSDKNRKRRKKKERSA